MSDVAIRVENLSKKFYLGERIGLRTFREALQDALARPLRRIIRGEKNAQAAEEKVDTDRQIWALKDVSFEVKHGEVLGIIGPNGAGKSTLLKILSRITEPTGGYAEIRGRVGSLLEVGTGFHPELTGRENVFLNGAILGMSKAEIRRKFDDIVAFAGVEKFIDTPVKRYSSGMQVRLAFAVAAHLDPEILIIDEVLAVGDAEFQKRCLGKMNEVSRSGRTVLFVSHNMAAVEGLCTNAILLRSGVLEVRGVPRVVLDRYHRAMFTNSDGVFEPALSVQSPRAYLPKIVRVILRSDDNTPTVAFYPRSALTVDVTFRTYGAEFSPVLGIVIKTCTGVPILGVDNRFIPGYEFPNVRSGTIRAVLDSLPLLPGQYIIDIYLGDRIRSIDVLRDAVYFQVLDFDIYGSGKLPGPSAGPVAWTARWYLTED